MAYWILGWASFWGACNSKYSGLLDLFSSLHFLIAALSPWDLLSHSILVLILVFLILPWNKHMDVKLKRFQVLPQDISCMQVLCNDIQDFVVVVFLCVCLFASLIARSENGFPFSSCFLFYGRWQRSSHAALHSSDYSMVLFFPSQPGYGAQGSCTCFNSQMCTDSSIPLLCCFSCCSSAIEDV